MIDEKESNFEKMSEAERLYYVSKKIPETAKMTIEEFFEELDKVDASLIVSWEGIRFLFPDDSYPMCPLVSLCRKKLGFKLRNHNYRFAGMGIGLPSHIISSIVRVADNPSALAGPLDQSVKEEFTKLLKKRGLSWATRDPL